MSSFHLAEVEILRDGRFELGEIGVADGRLCDEPTGRRIALPGCRVLPGMVDIHGDGFERHVAPRRGAMQDVDGGLRGLAQELAYCGITTAILAQFYSWEGGMRGPAFAADLLAAHARIAPEVPVDLRVQLRLEISLVDEYAAFDGLAAAHGVGYVCFNDHLPHASLAAGKRPPRLTGQALKGGRSPEAHLDLLQRLHRASDRVPAALPELIARLKARGVLMASHDDHTPANRRLWRGRGVAVSEFPETRDAAEEARQAGEPVVMGAPNVVRGGSHAGKVSARDMVAGGRVTALASDYHYPSMLAAAQVLGLAEAWPLVSEGPARILGLTDRGRIESGLRADLVILGPDGRVKATIAGGQIAYADPEVIATILG